MVHPSKRKGNAFEREIVSQARELGLPAKRAWGSDGRSLGENPEVDLVVDTIKIQAKRRAAIPAWLRPSEHVDAHAFREDRGEAFVMIPLWDYLQLLKQTRGLTDEKSADCLG
tara:strand:+ start:142 stop:480 length:339 start_codon:yes stop_codon:yes gene_type:complete